MLQADRKACLRQQELLQLCLQKVCALQEELQKSEDDENDPEAAGYAACAMETFRFLSNEGLSPDHPVIKGLAERLMKERE